jgi:hypothetical protein
VWRGLSAVIIDPEKLDSRSRYKLLIGAVVPRPIAWTSTVSGKGVRNFASFSYFTVASRKGEAMNWLRDPNYTHLRLGLENAHAAVEAATVEARRRVRIYEEDGRSVRR